MLLSIFSSYQSKYWFGAMDPTKSGYPNTEKQTVPCRLPSHYDWRLEQNRRMFKGAKRSIQLFKIISYSLNLVSTQWTIIEHPSLVGGDILNLLQCLKFVFLLVFMNYDVIMWKPNVLVLVLIKFFSYL